MATIQKRLDSLKLSSSIHYFVPKTPLEYPEMKLEPLNPFKPKGAHDSFTVRIIDSGLGLSVVGVASKMSVYGFDKMKIQQIEYVCQ